MNRRPGNGCLSIDLMDESVQSTRAKAELQTGLTHLVTSR